MHLTDYISGTFNVIDCEHESEYLTLSCPSSLTLTIAQAFWGTRSREDLCDNDVSTCVGTDAFRVETLDIVREECDGEVWCDIETDTDVLGEPCQGVRKYLEVDYDCGMFVPCER